MLGFGVEWTDRRPHQSNTRPAATSCVLQHHSTPYALHLRATFNKDAAVLFNLATFTLFHVLVSIAGIVAGCVVVGGLISGKRLDGWTGTFLVTTALTNLTGFGFPFVRLIPSYFVGALSLLILPVTAYALYGKHLEGSWRKTYVVTSVTVLYFNVFVLIAQMFAKVPAMIALAPTQKEPPFGLTQLVVLIFFVWTGRVAVRGFRSA